ncbi:MAG: Fe-S-containing hydro-lyase [Candidatus Izemoplasmatales bacterium]|jgi:fumarate hydratase subunit beta|nr:Fe-S-containing hydro-lyase [Candidatus Izemoplasmatales bacterium]
MIKLKTPISEETRLSLRAGEQILLSGVIYTGRDAAHKRLVESVKENHTLPINFNHQIIYYVGPTPPKPSMPIGSCGPTSSYRMDPYSNVLMPYGLKCMIGKGDRSDEFIIELVKNKAVYFIAIGGIGAKLSKSVKSSKVILYDELQSEAIRELYVEDFPVIVAYDSVGNNVFKQKDISK